jgi:short-subunit dehydrogenase
MQKKSIEDLTIWVTGASHGIGLAIARKLADNNAKVILSARSQDSFRDVIPIFADSNNVFFFPCDVSKTNSVSKTYYKISAGVGEVDVLINNAGIAIFKLFNDMTLEDFEAMNCVNYKGVFLCTKAVLPSMIERKSGIILNINSVSSHTVFRNASLYAASKAASLAMSRHIRNEVREHGIKVVDILPGATETPIWSEHARQKYSEKMMQPEDIADVVFNTINLCLNDRIHPEEIIVRPQGGDL